MTDLVVGRRSVAPLYFLALGTFAIGTEGFMIAPLLPDLAADLGVSVVKAGQLVTVFALTYAFSSPVLTALTAGLDRRRQLIGAMIAFAASNAVAFTAPSYGALMGARVLLAISAGLYVPSALALAGALLEPERRGTALAMVTGGTTVAVALGVPLGAIVGDRFGWRLTFAGVGALAVIATIGLLLGLARNIGSGQPTATLRERIAVGRRKPVLLGLLVTTLWAAGAYTVYTYLALFLGKVAGIHGPYVSMVLFLWGIAAAGGIFLGGASADRFGASIVMRVSLTALALAFVTLSLSAATLSPAQALVPVLLAVLVWGVSAWSFYPAQQVRLIGIGGVALAPVVLSLNASFMFIGFSLGALLGSITLAHGSVGALGWVGAAFVAAGLGLAATTESRPALQSSRVCPQAT